jgi:tRNA(Ile)-lysidine synthase
VAAPLATRVARELDRLGLEPGAWLVAVSGGPDSLALLHLLIPLARPRGLLLVVAHADHGIDPESGSVAHRVRALAASLGVPFALGRLELGPGASETVARRARYAWLRREAAERGARGLLTAHHADDQAETVLMRVLEGSGPAGLAGMHARAGDVVRPLLPFRREELAQYVLDVGAEPWLDPANDDPRHLRAWLRHDVVPALRRRLPDVEARLARVARQARRDAAAWDGALDVLGLEPRPEGAGLSVRRAPLLAGGPALAERRLQALLRRLGRPLPTAAARRVRALLEAGASGSRADLGSGWRAEVAFDRLVVGPVEAVPAEVELAGRGEVRWGRWAVSWRPEAAGPMLRGGSTTWVTPGPLQLGPPRAGERLRPLGGTGHRHLVRLLQDAGVARGARAGWPVVRRGGTALWLAGIARGAAEVPEAGEEAIRLDVRPA